MADHDLKCWEQPFDAMWDCAKGYEIRINDRDYQVGDTLTLSRFVPSTQTYSGRVLVVEVTYMTNGGEWGIPAGMCVMSTRIVRRIYGRDELAASRRRGSEMEEEAMLRQVLDAAPEESAVDAARRLIDELLEWRGGCEAAFGIMTASPRKTLVDLAIAQRDHHREHHEREHTAWSTVLALAVHYRARASERAADKALAELDEQGMPE